MPKNRNMGHKSHMAIDGELAQNQLGMSDELSEQRQPTRPTVHPQQPTRTAGDAPLRRHSRRGD